MGCAPCRVCRDIVRLHPRCLCACDPCRSLSRSTACAIRRLAKSTPRQPQSGRTIADEVATGRAVSPIQDVSDAELARCRAEIAKLLPLWPRELADMSPAGRAHVVAVLERALRAERRRGLAGHWTYNLARHVQLLRPIARRWRPRGHAGSGPSGTLGRRRPKNSELKPGGRSKLRRDEKPACTRRSLPTRGYFSRRVPSPIFLARSERARA